MLHFADLLARMRKPARPRGPAGELVDQGFESNWTDSTTVRWAERSSSEVPG